METNQKDEFSEIGSMQDVLTGVSGDPSSANGHGSGRRRCHGRCKHSHQRKDSSDEEPINKLSWHLRSLWIVIPFFLLFLLKEAVAHSKGFWVIISLFVSSFYINSRVSKAALGFESPTYALFASSWTFVSVAFLHYVPYLRDDAIYLGLICVPNLIPASDWVSLLWAVIVVDFSLRILTIFVKSFVIYLTSRHVIEFSQQSAFLVWVEFVSQVYRNIPPAVTWVRHLTTASDRHSFAFLVFLTVLYLFLKVVALGLLSSSMWPVFKYDAFSQPYQTVTVAPESEVDGSSPQFCAMCLNRLSPNVAILGCNQLLSQHLEAPTAQNEAMPVSAAVSAHSVLRKSPMWERNLNHFCVVCNYSLTRGCVWVESLSPLTPTFASFFTPKRDFAAI